MKAVPFFVSPLFLFSIDKKCIICYILNMQNKSESGVIE